MRVFGIDPGSQRTGYGCVDSDGRRHQLVSCGAIRAGVAATFPEQLSLIYRELSALIAEHRPGCVAIENIFHAVNARSALKLGHARGVAMLAATEAGVTVVEYTPAEVKRAVVGYGRAEKAQVAQMVKLLLGLDEVPTPHDAADALAVAICHLHAGAVIRNRVSFSEPGTVKKKRGFVAGDTEPGTEKKKPGFVSDHAAKSWRHYKPPQAARK